MSPTPFIPFTVSNTPKTNATSSDDVHSSFRPGGSSNGRNNTTTFGHGRNMAGNGGNGGSSGSGPPAFNEVPTGVTIPYDGNHSIFSGIPTGLTIPYDNVHSIFDDVASGTLTVTQTTSAAADATLIGSGRFPSTTVTLPAPTTRAFDDAILTATVFLDSSAASTSTIEFFYLDTSSPLPTLPTLIISTDTPVSPTLVPTLEPLAPLNPSRSPSSSPLPSSSAISKRDPTDLTVLGAPNSLGYSPWHEWSTLPNTKLILSFLLLTLFLSWIMFGLCWFKRRQTRKRNAGVLPRRWWRSQEEDWEKEDEKGLRVISARGTVGTLGSEAAESAVGWYSEA